MNLFDGGPIKVKHPEPLEKHVESYLVSRMISMGGECIKWENGQRGVPDRICIFPGGQVWFVEVKRGKGGKLSKLQDRFFRRMSQLGMNNTQVVYGKEGVDEWMKELGCDVR